MLEQSAPIGLEIIIFYLFSDASIWNMSEDRYLQLVLHTEADNADIQQKKKLYHRRTGCFQ